MRKTKAVEIFRAELRRKLHAPGAPLKLTYKGLAAEYSASAEHFFIYSGYAATNEKTPTLINNEIFIH